ncbi:VanZ family protein [Chryseobacterium arthrosphaerae]|uniref:Teicoplanin resistance protein VanZ n=1 Tax=Chryseobacterium arthrosphaerae TaxID=651561 RepID=A0A1B8ZUC1_9FLAO|nr:VanZ family protein [Chryseobacterium arthrosphaerae]MDG4653098.1 VanZ family protein [Chryseobacterium arthrosphaerae]OCA75164.1 teicoplanin resistance protein VanZ [Chryseobacterium arthrosphaerae]RTZ49809.1 VanZ family protein [Chryseobacterium arthrosphaerae]WET00319.1 VanZ family protein [Chryseobacterium arthrosphaerae]
MLKKIYKAVIVPYTLFLLYLMFLGMGRFQYEDNLIRVEPVFSTIEFIQNSLDWKYILMIVFGNIIMFIPFGFSGWVFPELKDLKTLIFAFISTIVIVEALQYFTRMGIFEVDDIILNTFGVYLGWLMCRYIEKRFNY